jgi:hypothetical protein
MAAGDGAGLGFQCGLACSDTQDEMSFFSLCHPFEVGDAAWILFAGLLILFIGSFCSIPLAYSSPSTTTTTTSKFRRSADN